MGTDLTFDESTHTYRVGGDEVPSVTTITRMLDKSGPLMWWVANEARDYIRRELSPGETVDEVRIDELAEGARLAHKRTSQRAANIGTRAHSWCERYITDYRLGDGPEPEMPHAEPVAEAVIEFLDWEEQHDVEWLVSEVRVYSERYNYAGTFDARAVVDGAGYILDFKTSKAVYDDMWMQLAAYRQAYYEQSGKDQLIGILHLPKTRAEFCWHPLDDTDDIAHHFGGFRGAHALYQWKQGN